MLIQLVFLVKGEKSKEIEFYKLQRQVNYEIILFQKPEIF
jgi:hypothetical protein